jgi:hypothetical protein
VRQIWAEYFDPTGDLLHVMGSQGSFGTLKKGVQSRSSTQLFGIQTAGAGGNRTALHGPSSLSLKVVQILGTRQTYIYPLHYCSLELQ